MREKELRLALVFFGGVSLAIYIHGITKELLKLVRASSALHGVRDRHARLGTTFYDRPDARPGLRADPEYDSEAVYYDLLREIGRKVDLRIIIDTIAGASAGGINGVMLARALAHDLPFSKLRDLWLAEADVSLLIDPSRRAKAWSKWFMTPLIWAAGWTGLLRPIQDPEVRKKLSLFTRSRWFQPPFDGLRMSALMLGAVESMGEPREPGASLLPSGIYLELFVTLTDFFGYHQPIQIHDPPVIREREHRHILRFAYRRWPSGDIDSDFTMEDGPALAFAARATSSFPGAFPPAQIGEMDRLLALRGVVWKDRDGFLLRNFERYQQSGMDPVATSFIDGSTLNNKPFNEAIQSIKNRPAYREVDRRLVYIDPDPVRPSPPPSGQVPGFFSTLKGALSDLPRNEPIGDELAWVTGFNDRVRRLRGIVDSARPQVSDLVARVVGDGFARAASGEEIQRWRQTLNTQVARNAGFAYEGYVRLKMSGVRSFVADLMARLCGVPERSPSARSIAEIVEAWADRRGLAYRSDGLPGDAAVSVDAKDLPTATLPAWTRFLLRFDVEFRKRRLSFLIQGQNRLYGMLDDGAAAGSAATLIDRLKRSFYDCLESLRRCDRPMTFSAGSRELALRLFGALPPAMLDSRQLAIQAQAFVDRHAADIDRLVDGLAQEIDLDAATHDIDNLLADMNVGAWPADVRRDVLINYLGFPFWDVLTFSVTSWRDVGEFNEIRIDRISPEDSPALAAIGAGVRLQGTNLASFGAFFSRRYRENDYLLARLHAADRLIDIVCDGADVNPATDGIDVGALKRRMFATIIDAEAPHLTRIPDLIAELRRKLLGTA